MDELSRRLAALDPAGAPPSELDGALEALARERGRKRRWRRAATIGGSVAVVAALAAGANLDAYLLSIPPYQTLDEGAVRTTEGLPYTEPAGPGQVRDCLLFAEFSGVTPEQFAAADAVWSAIEPERFFSERDARRPHGTGSNYATIQQVLAEFEPVLPGIAWGADDGPSLHGLSGSCEPAE